MGTHGKWNNYASETQKTHSETPTPHQLIFKLLYPPTSFGFTLMPKWLSNGQRWGWISIHHHCNCLPIQMMNLSDAGVTYLIIAMNLFLELLKPKLPQTKRCTYHLLFFSTTIKKLDLFFH